MKANWETTLQSIEEVLKYEQITEYDCGTIEGIRVSELVHELGFAYDYEYYISSLRGRIVPLYEDFFIDIKDNILTDEIIRESQYSEALYNICFRSPLTCEATNGVCAKCCGIDNEILKEMSIGDNIGKLATEYFKNPIKKKFKKFYNFYLVSERKG